MALLLLAVLTAAALLFVAFPLIREARADDVVQTLTPEQRDRLELRERRDHAYAALRELELEHRTGKLTDDDYAIARHELRAEAIDALRRLEALEGETPEETEGTPSPPGVVRG